MKDKITISKVTVYRRRSFQKYIGEYQHLIHFPDGTLRYPWEDPNSFINMKSGILA